MPRKWQYKHLEVYKERDHAYYEKRKEYFKEYYKKNTEKCKEWLNAWRRRKMANNPKSKYFIK